MKYNPSIVPIPERMKGLQKDKRGYPAPYIVVRDKSGEPKFTINDSNLSLKCVKEDLCTVCGQKLNDDKWLIGGIMSAFHPNGAFGDLPVHRDCGEYSLKVCPYLAMSSYHSKLDLSKIDVSKISDKPIALENLTAGNTKLEFFCFVKISGYSLTTNMLLKAEKPYLAIEFWKDGEQITDKQVEAIMKQKTEKVVTIVESK